MRDADGRQPADSGAAKLLCPNFAVSFHDILMPASARPDRLPPAAAPIPAAVDVLAIARQVLQEEADALHDVAAALSATPDFVRCVQAILNLKGRVVVTGIGKSAHIAGKIGGRELAAFEQAHGQGIAQGQGGRGAGGGS